VLGDFLTDISEEGRDAIVAAVRVRPMQENKAGESKTGFTENNQLMFEGPVCLEEISWWDIWGQAKLGGRAG